jgi:hypothetical protein
MRKLLAEKLLGRLKQVCNKLWEGEVDATGVGEYLTSDQSYRFWKHNAS